jgi:steroid delta-isomerase-like uncharacterized protein
MKKLCIGLSLALIFCFIVGCQDKAAMAELEEFRAQAALEEQNKALVEDFFEELNKGNVEIWKELCAPEFAFYLPSEATEPLSLEQTYESFKMLLKGFPDIHWKIHELIAKGDKVIVRFTQTGTHEGEFQGIPATGNKTKVSIISILQFKDGKCIEIREEEDAIGIMQQLGFELKPKEGEKE